jgi:putative transposase
MEALMMAVCRLKPDGGAAVHSDQGSQHGSDDWLRFWWANNQAPSMSRRGNGWDNAVAESFFSSLKKRMHQEENIQNPGSGPGGYLRLH